MWSTLAITLISVGLAALVNANNLAEKPMWSRNLASRFEVNGSVYYGFDDTRAVLLDCSNDCEETVVSIEITDPALQNRATGQLKNKPLHDCNFKFSPGQLGKKIQELRFLGSDKVLVFSISEEHFNGSFKFHVIDAVKCQVSKPVEYLFDNALILYSVFYDIFVYDESFEIVFHKGKEVLKVAFDHSGNQLTAGPVKILDDPKIILVRIFPVSSTSATEGYTVVYEDERSQLLYSKRIASEGGAVVLGPKQMPYSQNRFRDLGEGIRMRKSNNSLLDCVDHGSINFDCIVINDQLQKTMSISYFEKLFKPYFPKNLLLWSVLSNFKVEGENAMIFNILVEDKEYKRFCLIAKVNEKKELLGISDKIYVDQLIVERVIQKSTSDFDLILTTSAKTELERLKFSI